MIPTRLEQVARGFAVAILFAAPALLGYFPEGDYHWLGQLLPALSEYRVPVMGAHLAICLAAALCLVASGLRGPIGARLDLVGIGAVALVVGMAIATARSVSPHASLLELTRVLDCVALFFLVRYLCRAEWARLVAVAAIVAGGCLVAVFGLRHYVETAARGDPGWGEFGSFGNPNSFAGYLLIVIPLAAGLHSVRRQSLERLALAVAGLLMGAALLVSHSRGGILAAGICGLGVTGWWLWRASRRAAWVACGVLVLVVVVTLLAPPTRGVLTAVAQSDSTQFRLYTWLGAWRMFLARPLLGSGPGTFADAFPQYTVAGFTRMAHNKDLQVAAECGVAGLLPLAFLFIAYLATTALRLRRLDDRRGRAIPLVCLVAVLGFCLHSLVDFDWYAPAIALTVLAIMALPVVPAREGEAEAEPPRVPSRGERKERQRRAKRGQAAERAVSRPGWLSLALAVVGVGLIAAWGVRELAAGVHLSGGRRAVVARDARAAEAEFRRAAELSPLDPLPHFELGLLYEGLFRATGASALWWQAQEGFRHALARTTSVSSWAHLASLHEAVGDLSGAAALQSAAADLAPRDPYMLATLARLYEAGGADALAAGTYQRLSDLYESPVGQIEAFEGTTDFRYAYAWLYFADRAREVGDQDAAEALLDRAEALLVRYTTALQKRRPLYEAQGRWPPGSFVEAERLHERLRRTRAQRGG